MPMLVEALRGVPKPVLRTALGKELGERVWARTRSGSPARLRVRETASATAAEASDDEIVLALLRHLCRRAAQSLVRERRRALVLSLSMEFEGGHVVSRRARLPRPATTDDQLLREAEPLYRRVRTEGGLGNQQFTTSVCRLRLDVTVTVPEAAPQSAPIWRWRNQAEAGLA